MEAPGPSGSKRKGGRTRGTKRTMTEEEAGLEESFDSHMDSIAKLLGWSFRIICYELIQKNYIAFELHYT